MEYKLPGNSISNNMERDHLLELQFNIEKEFTSFTVTPNPAHSFFQLQSESIETVEIKMLNMLGEFVAPFRFNNESESISTTNFAKGVYILMKSNTAEVQKLILQ